jgi:hypothetical protein
MCRLDPTWGQQPRKTRDPKHTSTSDEQWTYINWLGTRHILLFLFSFPDNITADVASKQQTTALFLPTTVTLTRRHTEVTKKTGKPDGETCAVPENIQFRFSCSFYTVKLHSLAWNIWVPLECMGTFRVLWGPLEYMGPFRVLWETLKHMGPFRVYGTL